MSTHLSGNMRNPLSIPGVYERKAARAVSKIKPKLRAQLRIPWWTIELRRVLQMIKSAHCTTTMETKKAVWHVYSNVFLSRYVCGQHTLSHVARWRHLQLLTHS